MGEECVPTWVREVDSRYHLYWMKVASQGMGGHPLIRLRFLRNCIEVTWIIPYAGVHSGRSIRPSEGGGMFDRTGPSLCRVPGFVSGRRLPGPYVA